MSCQQPIKGTALRPSSLACRWHRVAAEAPSGRPQTRRVVSKDMLCNKLLTVRPNFHQAHRSLLPRSSSTNALSRESRLAKPIVAGRVRSATRPALLTRSPTEPRPGSGAPQSPPCARDQPEAGQNGLRGDDGGGRPQRERIRDVVTSVAFLLLFKKGSDRLKGGRAHLL